jgi:hypothetical protein
MTDKVLEYDFVQYLFSDDVEKQLLSFVHDASGSDPPSSPDASVATQTVYSPDTSSTRAREAKYRDDLQSVHLASYRRVKTYCAERRLNPAFDPAGQTVALSYDGKFLSFSIFIFVSSLVSLTTLFRCFLRRSISEHASIP